MLALAAVVAVHAAAFLLAGAPLVRAYGRVLFGDPAGTPAPAADPITGDIQLTFQYPAYMKREPRTLSGTGGEIRAPKGTEVTLETRADRDVKQAELVVEYEVDPAAPGRPSTPGPDERRERSRHRALRSGRTGGRRRGRDERSERRGGTTASDDRGGAATGEGRAGRSRGNPFVPSVAAAKRTRSRGTRPAGAKRYALR